MKKLLYLLIFCFYPAQSPAELTLSQRSLVDEFISLLPDDVSRILSNPLSPRVQPVTKQIIKDELLYDKMISFEVEGVDGRAYFTNEKRKELLDKIGQMTFLSKLHLVNFGFEVIPDQLRNLKLLTELNCSHNHISALPDWLLELSHLDALYVQHNQLRYFPSSLEPLFMNDSFQIYLFGNSVYLNSFGPARGVSYLLEHYLGAVYVHSEAEILASHGFDDFTADEESTTSDDDEIEESWDDRENQGPNY